jgi:hypothetical protein
LFAAILIAVVIYLAKVVFGAGEGVVSAVDPSRPILLDDASPPY